MCWACEQDRFWAAYAAYTAAKEVEAPPREDAAAVTAQAAGTVPGAELLPASNRTVDG